MMKRQKLLLLLAVLFLLFSACNTSSGNGSISTQATNVPSKEAQSTPEPTSHESPNPHEDYGAFYEYLLQQQSEGSTPYEDKLLATGQVSDAFSIVINGKPFTNKEAETLTVYTATFQLYTKVEGHLYSWVGYRFTEVCDLLGLALEDSIRLIATDGYKQIVDVKNIDHNTMLAITKDGDPSEGPYFAPCTYLISANYTKYLAEIEILPATEAE